MLPSDNVYKFLKSNIVADCMYLIFDNAENPVYAYLHPQQFLLKCKQGFIDFKDIIIAVFDEILNDEIKFTAAREGKTSFKQ